MKKLADMGIALLFTAAIFAYWAFELFWPESDDSENARKDGGK